MIVQTDIGQRLAEVYGISDNSVDAIMENCVKMTCPRNSILLEEGTVSRFVYFIESGYIRGYTIRHGCEMTYSFALEGESVMPPVSKTGVSMLSYMAMENSSLIGIERDRLEMMYANSAELANMGRHIAERQLADYDIYFLDYFWEDHSRQWEIFSKEHPELLQRASLKDIASYLHITPQSLSRIRRNRK